MEPTTPALKKLNARKVMRAAELEPFVSSRAQLRRMAESGEIVTLGSGLYAHPSIDPFTASLIAVSRYFPKAVISNVTALVVHGLSDERVELVDVDIPRNTSIRNKLIRAHRVQERFIFGAIKLDVSGQKIRIYSKERALCDAYRIDPDGPLFLKAVKRYVKLNEINTDLIAKYDGLLSSNVLRALTQELVNE